MKRIFCLFACFATLIAYAQRGGYNETVREGPFVENDTTFIQKVYHTGPNKYDNYTDKLYIETDHESEAYNQIVYASYDPKYDMTQILLSVKEICQQCTLVEQTHSPINGCYLPLYKYRGKYYLYCPSERGLTNRRQIACPFLICQYIDGMQPYGITQLTKTSTTSWHIESDDAFDNADLIRSPESLDIYEIGNGIQVWKYKTNGSQPSYSLYVNIDNAKNFDMIVWKTMECQPEFDGFDEIDYESIIRHKRLF